jgi:hypothetical protein
MNSLKKSALALVLSFFIMGGLSTLAPLTAHAGKIPVKIGKPVITQDQSKQPPKKGH